MEYMYIWEISGQTKVGTSSQPSADLRALEAEFGQRATKVFTTRLTTPIRRALKSIFPNGPGYTNLTFMQAKEAILNYSSNCIT